MSRIPSLALLLLLTACGSAEREAAPEATPQPDPRGPIAAFEAELVSGRTTAQQLLHDPRASSVRAEREFRRLLLKHSPEGTLRLTPDDEPGTPLRIEGRVVDEAQVGIPGARVWLFQTDARGHYRPEDSADDRRARLFGFVRTDANGRFVVNSVRPAPYAHALETPAHVHIEVRARGYVRARGEGPPCLHFADDPRLVAAHREEILSDGGVISPVRREADGTQVVTYRFPMKRDAAPR